MTNQSAQTFASAALLEGRTLQQGLLPDRRDRPPREQLVRRVRAEFDEMPCLRLTLAQAARLFSLPEDVCARLLQALVRDGALWRGIDGRYGRRDR